MEKIDYSDFYVCPNHFMTSGWEGCCSCGGWSSDEKPRLCTEAIANGETLEDSS